MTTTAERIRKCEGAADNMLGSLAELAELCRKALALHEQIEELAEVCDVGFVPYDYFRGGYYRGVTSNVLDIRREAARLQQVRG